ncbi:hypothetical protein LguiA_004092 [Lonicera macranthoides]
MRIALEAGLRFTQGALPSPTSVDEKVKAEMEEIAQEEAEVNNLKHKADDLGIQLNQQREQNSGIVRDLSNEPQQTRNQQGKLKDKQKESEATAPSRVVEKPIKKKTDLAKTLRQLPQNPQLDLSRISKSIGGVANPASPPGTGKPGTTGTKKSNTRNEGANSTTSALSKLTNRLNFLKERRTQLEQQKQERSGGKESESSQPLTNTDKFQGSEGQLSEKGRGAESCLFQPADSKGAEGLSVQNSEKYNKSDAQNLQHTDKGKRNEAPSTANLDKEKSESFPAGDKGRSTNAAAASRTNSR